MWNNGPTTLQTPITFFVELHHQTSYSDYMFIFNDNVGVKKELTLRSGSKFVQLEVNYNETKFESGDYVMSVEVWYLFFGLKFMSLGTADSKFKLTGMISWYYDFICLLSDPA